MINNLQLINETIEQSNNIKQEEQTIKEKQKELENVCYNSILFYFDKCRIENTQSSDILKDKYKILIEQLEEITSQKETITKTRYNQDGTKETITETKNKYDFEFSIIYNILEKQFNKIFTQYQKEQSQLNKINIEEQKQKLIDEFNYQFKQYKNELKTKNIIYLLNDEEVKEKIINTLAETTGEQETLKKLYNPTLKQFKNSLSITIEQEKAQEKANNQIKIPKITKFYLGLKVTRKLLKI